MCIYNFAISRTGNLNIVLVLSDTSERKEHKLLKVYIPMSYQPFVLRETSVKCFLVGFSLQRGKFVFLA